MYWHHVTGVDVLAELYLLRNGLSIFFDSTRRRPRPTAPPDVLYWATIYTHQKSSNENEMLTYINNLRCDMIERRNLHETDGDAMRSRTTKMGPFSLQDQNSEVM